MTQSTTKRGRGFLRLWPLFLFLPPLHAQTPAARDAFLLGSDQFARQHFQEAKTSFIQAIRLDPYYAPAYRALGLAELELKEYDSAFHAWLKAVQLDPKDEKSEYLLGRLFYEADLPNEAAAWLRKAIAQKPADFEATTYLGLCAEALGYDKTAVQLYRHAIAESDAQIRPFSWAFLSLGNYLKKHGDPEGAAQVLQQGSSKCPEPHELTAWAELLTTQGKRQQAETVLRQAVAMDTTLSQPHYRLALLLNSLGKHDDAALEMSRFKAAKAKEDQAPKIAALRQEIKAQ